MNCALCINKKVISLIFPLLAVTAFAQDPAAEILSIISDQASSPLDFVSAPAPAKGGVADEMGVLDLLSGKVDGDDEMGALDFISSGFFAGTGALDFISATASAPSFFTAANGFGMGGGAMLLPFATQRITSGFGYRPKFGRMHKGIDIAMTVGDTVRVPLAGTVRKVSYEARGYGHYVTVVHDDGMETRYAHLSQTLVMPGQRLEAGEPIALSGNSGNSTGPHLHFETRYLGAAVNPAEIFSLSASPISGASDAGMYIGYGMNGMTDSNRAGVANLDYGANVVGASKRTYIVRQGDTLEKISRKTGVPVFRLCQLNFITESAPLESGRMLKIR
jgi:peptidase, M23 family